MMGWNRVVPSGLMAVAPEKNGPSYIYEFPASHEMFTGSSLEFSMLQVTEVRFPESFRSALWASTVSPADIPSLGEAVPNDSRFPVLGVVEARALDAVLNGMIAASAASPSALSALLITVPISRT